MHTPRCLQSHRTHRFQLLVHTCSWIELPILPGSRTFNIKYATTTSILDLLLQNMNYTEPFTKHVVHIIETTVPAIKVTDVPVVLVIAVTISNSVRFTVCIQRQRGSI